MRGWWAETNPACYSYSTSTTLSLQSLHPSVPFASLSLPSPFTEHSPCSELTCSSQPTRNSFCWIPHLAKQLIPLFLIFELQLATLGPSGQHVHLLSQPAVFCKHRLFKRISSNYCSHTYTGNACAMICSSYKENKSCKEIKHPFDIWSFSAAGTWFFEALSCHSPWGTSVSSHTCKYKSEITLLKPRELCRCNLSVTERAHGCQQSMEQVPFRFSHNSSSSATCFAQLHQHM